jgi:hypothetical protein
MSWDVQVPFLSEMSFEVFRCLVCCQVHVLFDIVFPQTPDILFLLDVCNNRGKLSYLNDELVSL